MLRVMLLAFLLAAIAPSQTESLRALVATDVRVAMVGDRLARGGLCNGVLSSPGWVVQDADQYASSLRPAARHALGLGAKPTIVAILPGGAAARAGLRPGDEIEAVQGQAVGEPRKGYGRLARLEQQVETGLTVGPIAVRFRRAGALGTVTVSPETGCASRFQLLPGAGLNAKADGTYVQVSGGLVEFVRSDDELALVMAHELAHNILGHRARLDAAGVSRGLLAGFGKNRGRIRETELEADRLALYLMARAGYDFTIAPVFWQRFGRKLVPGFLSDGTHPGTSERVRRAESEIALIKAARASGRQPTP